MSFSMKLTFPVLQSNNYRTHCQDVRQQSGLLITALAR